MSVGSMSVLSIYSAQFQHHVRRLLRRARRRQRRRSQRKRSRRRRHRVHTTRGDPTEKPTENATGKVHVRTREEDEEPLAAPSQEQERLLVPSTTSLSDLPGVVRRVDYLFFAAESAASAISTSAPKRGASSFPSPTRRRTSLGVVIFVGVWSPGREPRLLLRSRHQDHPPLTAPSQQSLPGRLVPVVSPVAPRTPPAPRAAMLVGRSSSQQLARTYQL